MDYLKKEKFQKDCFFQTICRRVLLERIVIKLSMLSPRVRGGGIDSTGFLGRDLTHCLLHWRSSCPGLSQLAEALVG